ncbi:MAG TPA: hypothetical protein VNN06_07275 [Ramlibacter sp.]|nr:hypothetical protein [Ramlibacter sp.]
MNRNLPLAVLCLAASAWIAPAAAQAIYRCGDSYSQQPCPGGTQVQADDARSAAQGSQTRQAAQRDAKAADAMEKARLKEEAKPAQAYIPPPKVQDAPPQDGGTEVSAKAKKPAYFTAAAPRKPGEASAKKKKKARKKAA